jgi:GNAT superfamily N-acetyltransferase
MPSWQIVSAPFGPTMPLTASAAGSCPRQISTFILRSQVHGAADRFHALFEMSNSRRYPGQEHTLLGHVSYSIRPAQASDLDRLVELLLALQDHVESANPNLWRMKPEARGNLKGQIAGRLKADHGCALVAQHEEDGVIGVIFGRVVTNHRYVPSRAGQVDQVFVRTDHRRGGVGSRLLAELCRFFAAEEVEDISLRYVAGNDEAAGFWSAVGFSPRIITSGANRQEVEGQLARNCTRSLTGPHARDP